MNYKELYQKKLVTAEEAVKKIKNGDRISLPLGSGEPLALIDALAANAKNYKDVEIVQVLPLSDKIYPLTNKEGHIKANYLYAGAPAREAIACGRADFTTSFFYEMPHLFATELPVDVALIHLSKPDKYGYFSFGVSVDFTKRTAETAKTVIAQVNENMPRTLGDSFIHISEIDYLVECDHPLNEIPLPQITEVERTIGSYCASLIEDGDTLQLGIGSIPDAVLSFLHGKKDLGIHSEMISDGVIGLIEKGVITNRKKTLHKNKCVFTFLMGTKRLYDFCNDNPMMEMHPVDYTNNPLVIMQNCGMISINSCVQVDFYGQVASEMINGKQFSGVGGQVDFVRGANMGFDKKGKSIIAMPSTAAGGKASRIVPVIGEGVAVTTSRNDVNYVITEYGIAKLKGKTLKERARALINIAHPDFKEQLKQEFQKRFNCPF